MQSELYMYSWPGQHCWPPAKVVWPIVLFSISTFLYDFGVGHWPADITWSQAKVNQPYTFISHIDSQI